MWEPEGLCFAGGGGGVLVMPVGLRMVSWLRWVPQTEGSVEAEASEAAHVHPKEGRSRYGAPFGGYGHLLTGLSVALWHLSRRLPQRAASSGKSLRILPWQRIVGSVVPSCQGQSGKASEASGLLLFDRVPEWFSSAESAISLPSAPRQASNLMNNPQVQQL